MSKKDDYTSVIIDVNIDKSAYKKYKDCTGFFEVANNSVLDINTNSMLQTASHGGGSLHDFSFAASRPANYFILLKQDKRGKCAVNDLIMAFNWCIENNVSLISLSMGTTRFSDAAILNSIYHSAHY